MHSWTKAWLQKLGTLTEERSGRNTTRTNSTQWNSAIKNLYNYFSIHSRYRENAKLRSKLLHDRPMKPMDLAIYWTEFVIRNKGAPHLRVAGLDLPWYKYLLLDVVAFILIVPSISVFLLFIAIRKLWCNSVHKQKVKKS